MKYFDLNEKYFDVIDTEEKAYILGLIFADGNVSDGKDKHYRLRVTLKKDDNLLLERIKCELEFTGDIKIRELKSKTRKKPEPYFICELGISNKYMINRLKELGCVPNKSLIVKYPEIPKRLDKHFLRGYFDGNGSIYVSGQLQRKSSLKIEVCGGSNDIIESILDKYMEYVCGVTNGGFQHLKTYHRVAKSGNQALDILHFMYQGSKIHLERKFHLYSQYAVLYGNV
jgi:DNA-binding transcriptional regulator WhiA